MEPCAIIGVAFVIILMVALWIAVLMWWSHQLKSIHTDEVIESVEEALDRYTDKMLEKSMKELTKWQRSWMNGFKEGED